MAPSFCPNNMPVIIKAPDPRLREVSQPFDRGNAHHLVAIQDLKDGLAEYPRAMGLAAVQVGHMVRAIIIRGIGIMLNPVVVQSSPTNWTASMIMIATRAGATNLSHWFWGLEARFTNRPIIRWITLDTAMTIRTTKARPHHCQTV